MRLRDRLIKWLGGHTTDEFLAADKRAEAESVKEVKHYSGDLIVNSDNVSLAYIEVEGNVYLNGRYCAIISPWVGGNMIVNDASRDTQVHNAYFKGGVHHYALQPENKGQADG